MVLLLHHLFLRIISLVPRTLILHPQVGFFRLFPLPSKVLGRDSSQFGMMGHVIIRVCPIWKTWKSRFPCPLLKKDGGDDDPKGSNSSGASRGNWWQAHLITNISIQNTVSW
ncbi:uncharacterized protein LOC111294417 isoform X2 [Durio zibethinus]|uniref:Uncharacterized protein LOC111294417 isoform X2 n=1 Tax=Durio zibethinus TaxID=66656 RepID=A0A6P5YT40_DURZI|nr:uncharacterized protein LOC111294417 isoform X2 [Durio zibethinus]